ncbi:hypothetical protein PTKIN_Ptkin15bG0004900 [Pterospermum kingtungense]
MDYFFKFIKNLGLMDLPLVDGKFIWYTGRSNPTFCRLDHFLLRYEFFKNVLNLVQKVWPRSLSDRNSVSLSSDTINCGSKLFRFYNY